MENYGLTKENNDIIKNAGLKSSKTKQDNPTIVTEEHRKNISNSTKGKKKKPFTEEHKKNISIARAKQVFTEEHRRNQSIARKNIPKEKIICPHCQKEGGKPVMIRHHFDNCKRKPI